MREMNRRELQVIQELKMSNFRSKDGKRRVANKSGMMLAIGVRIRIAACYYSLGRYSG